MADRSENPGCLSVILKWFGFQPKTAEEKYPYRLRDQFLSPAEMAFYRFLLEMTGEKAHVLSKIRLADIFYVSQPRENLAYRNKIDRKHVDFLICDPNTMQPRFAIELDDRTHQREDRKARDAFVDRVFEASGLPLVHVKVQKAYDKTELAKEFRRALKSDRGKQSRE